jgi:hypothetical protein
VGWNNVRLAVMLMCALYLVRLVFDTAYDWFILMGAVVVAARLIPDEDVSTWFRLLRAHVRNRVDYAEWFNKEAK